MRKIKYLGYLLVLLVVSCQEKTSTVEAERPNIIFILADDLGYGDLSMNGQEKFETPNIDQLAAEGMAFTQHYAGSTVCAPSRSTLMTGMHTGHTGVRGNKEIRPEGQYALEHEYVTMAEMLKVAGYKTGAFGKWGLGSPFSEGDPLNQGFDRFFGYNCQRLAHNYYPTHLWDDKTKIVLASNEGDAESTYAPDLIQYQTLAFIEENKDVPFFAFVPSVIPHAELRAPESYISEFRGKFGQEEPYEGCDSGCQNYKIGGYGSQIEPRATFAGMMKLLDDQVGEIVAKVEDLGLTEKTIIIFSSDNGPHLEGGADPLFFDSNGPFRGAKRDLYEGGIKVPMIARWKGKIEAGTRSDHISAFWDFLPTFSELAGIKCCEGIDGISMVPTLLATDDQKEHGYLYWEFHELGGRRAIRQGKWKLIQYDVKKAEPKDFELYDVSSDTGEEQNLAADFPEVVERLSDLMKNREVSPIPEWNF